MAIKLSMSGNTQTDITYKEVNPKDFVKSDQYKDFVKLFKQFDKAEAEYYKKLHWHWNICNDKEIEEVLTKKTKRLFVAELNDSIVAFVTLWPGDIGSGSWTVAQICVDESHRGKKIGKNILQFVFDNTGKDQLFLTVVSTNEAGKHLYSSMGFKPMTQWMWKER